MYPPDGAATACTLVGETDHGTVVDLCFVMFIMYTTRTKQGLSTVLLDTIVDWFIFVVVYFCAKCIKSEGRELRIE